MNLILLGDQVSSCSFPQADPRFEHVRGVLRLREGDAFFVGCPRGPIGKATVQRLDAQGVHCTVVWEQLGRGAMPALPIDLLIGLSRPQTMRKILLEATALGIRNILVAPAHRSDPAYAKASLWTAAEWPALLRSGAEQGFHTWVPGLTLHQHLADACAATVSVAKTTLKIALDVYEADRPLSAILSRNPAPSCLLAIGPERGWSHEDRRLFREHGFQLASMGSTVLRVETAVTVALAVAGCCMGLY